MGPAPAAIHGRFLEVRGRRVFLREARPPYPP
jgi:hypothetical protein